MRNNDTGPTRSVVVEALDMHRSHPSPAVLDLANAIRSYAALKTQTAQHEEARVLWAEAGKLYEFEDRWLALKSAAVVPISWANREAANWPMAQVHRFHVAANVRICASKDENVGTT